MRKGQGRKNDKKARATKNKVMSLGVPRGMVAEEFEGRVSPLGRYELIIRFSSASVGVFGPVPKSFHT